MAAPEPHPAHVEECDEVIYSATLETALFGLQEAEKNIASAKREVEMALGHLRWRIQQGDETTDWSGR